MLPDPSTSPDLLAIVGLALFAALAFEFVNGFHDTANAVAVVIYTRALRPTLAVVLSGLMNFLGVLVAGVGVAYSVVHLFPIDLLLTHQPGSIAVTVVFSVLVSAIVWNLGTWYAGIPASSSHAMIGAILGCSMGYSLHQGLPLELLPWDKVRSVLAALLLSPLLGFLCAMAGMRLLRRSLKDERLFTPQSRDDKPPTWIRGLLIASCGAVSFAHGSNDGQKGMGLIMLILMCLLPASFSLNPQTTPEQRLALALQCRQVARTLQADGARGSGAEELLADYVKDGGGERWIAPVLATALEDTARQLESGFALEGEARVKLRSRCLLQIRCLRRYARMSAASPLETSQRAQLGACADSLERWLEYVSPWVKVAVAVALGLGTMVGWKRIVTTVGEKIGNSQLSYAQGVAAQMMAASTILLADGLKMPVSTTHVLSSGVAGTMVAERAGLQRRTLAHITLAWVLTLPVCITLGMGLFFLFLGRH